MTKENNNSELSKFDMACAKDFVKECYEKIEKKCLNKDKLTGCSTGFRDLDSMTNGLQPSDLIVIGARPSMGKTSFALNIAQNISIRQNIPVAIFSLEYSKEYIIQKIMCTEAEIDTYKVKTGNLQTNDWKKLSSAMNDIANSPIYIDDTSCSTIADISEKCRHLVKKEKNLGLVVIDYLQLIEGNKNDDRITQIAEITNGLKNLAKELNVPVIVLSQLSRAIETRKDKRPTLSDFRESKTIAQTADVVMFIYRDEYYGMGKEGIAQIIIAKNKYGEIGTFELEFQGNIQKFKDTIITEIF